MIGQPDPKDDNRPFPILAEIAYKEYCRLYGAGPTLERGGFGRQELIGYLQIKGYQHER